MILRLDEGLTELLGKLQRSIEIRLRNLLGRSFEHDHIVGTADVNEIQVTIDPLGMGRIGNEFAIDPAYPHGPQRPIPGNVAYHQRCRSANQRQHIGIVLAIGAEQDALHLDLIIPTAREQRPDWPVDQPAGKDFLLRRTPFAFEVAPGELARRGCFFAVIHSQGKEILTRFGLGGGDRGHQYDGFPHLDAYGPIGLFGQFTRFNMNLFVAHLDGDFF